MLGVDLGGLQITVEVFAELPDGIRQAFLQARRHGTPTSHLRCLDQPHVAQALLPGPVGKIGWLLRLRIHLLDRRVDLHRSTQHLFLGFVHFSSSKETGPQAEGTCGPKCNEAHDQLIRAPSILVGVKLTRSPSCSV